MQKVASSNLVFRSVKNAASDTEAAFFSFIGHSGVDGITPLTVTKRAEGE